MTRDYSTMDFAAMARLSHISRHRNGWKMPPLNRTVPRRIRPQDVWDTPEQIAAQYRAAHPRAVRL